MAEGNFKEDNTTRVMVRYQGPAGAHKWLLRFGNLVIPATLITRTNAFIAVAKAALFTQVSITGAQWAPPNSSAFVPLAVDTPTGTSGVDYNPATMCAAFNVHIPFKSDGGSPYHVDIFYTNAFFNQSNTFSFDDAPAAFTDIRDVLENGTYTAIDGENIASMGHLTTGDNASTLKKLRR